MKVTRDQTAQASSRIGFLQLLGLLFIGLKLLGYIGWSWWWVLLPLYAPIVVVGIVLFFLGLLFLLAHLMEKRARKARQKRIDAARRN